MYRLATVAKELSDKLARASAEKQREIVGQSCEFALHKTGANNRLTEEYLTHFQKARAISAVLYWF